jgi:protein-S-isoprenylcysteine O-methyltransferase Ste14
LNTIKIIIIVGLAIFILHWFVGAVKRKTRHEIFMSAGYGLFVSSFLFSVGDISVPKGIWFLGFFLLLVAFAVFILSAVTLRVKGKPPSGWEDTTEFIDIGIYGVVRHPIYLAAIVGAIGAILVNFSLSAMVLNLAAVFLFVKTCIAEDEFNLGKFGDSYRDYVERVPGLNFLGRGN